MRETPAPLHVVWFKRDLRLRDHAPLLAAARHAPVVGLYVYEPDVYGDPEFDAAHLEFINQSLLALEADRGEVGGRLLYRAGRMPEVLGGLHQDYGVAGIYAHEETGNAVSSWAINGCGGGLGRGACRFTSFPAALSCGAAPRRVCGAGRGGSGGSGASARPSCRRPNASSRAPSQLSATGHRGSWA